MLDRQGGRLVFECDGCSEVLETETRDFEESRQELRTEGWVARREGFDWMHYCSECK